MANPSPVVPDLRCVGHSGEGFWPSPVVNFASISPVRHRLGMVGTTVQDVDTDCVLLRDKNLPPSVIVLRPSTRARRTNCNLRPGRFGSGFGFRKQTTGGAYHETNGHVGRDLAVLFDKCVSYLKQRNGKTFKPRNQLLRIIDALAAGDDQPVEGELAGSA